MKASNPTEIQGLFHSRITNPERLATKKNEIRFGVFTCSDCGLLGCDSQSIVLQMVTNLSGNFSWAIIVIIVSFSKFEYDCNNARLLTNSCYKEEVPVFNDFAC